MQGVKLEHGSIHDTPASQRYSCDMHTKHFPGRSELSLIAAQAMVERGLEPEFPIRALHDVQAMTHAGDDQDPRAVDLTALA